METSSRTCRICKEQKPLARFSLRHKDRNIYRHECKECANKARKTQPSHGVWHKVNKNRVKEYMRVFDLKRHYGITLDEFNTLLNSQDGACAICKTSNWPGKGKKPHVDHCHNTGKIRGLLCNLCNVGLGAFKDNEGFLANAVNYLKKAAG